MSLLILNSTQKKSAILHKEIRYECFMLTRKLARSLITDKHNHPTASNFIDYSPAERIINFDQSRQAKLWKCFRHKGCELSHSIVFNAVPHLRIPWLPPLVLQPISLDKTLASPKLWFICLHRVSAPLLHGLEQVVGRVEAKVNRMKSQQFQRTRWTYLWVEPFLKWLK